MKRLTERPAHTIALAACLGLAFANATRIGVVALVLATAAAGLTASRLRRRPLLAVAIAVFFVGWWWGSARLAALDRSSLMPRIGTAERLRAVVTSTPRRGRFDIRVEGTVTRYGALLPDERVLLRLRPGRAPPQGAVIDALGQLAAPRPARNGFDERRWLGRHGIHVVVRVDAWTQVGRRGGIGGISDRLRVWLGRSVARGVHGERAALLEGIVLGDDAGLSDNLRMRFRASGLYHLLAVSGQNVALVAAGALALAWLLGVSRGIGQIAALLSIGAYVLAVGPQPSVIRAGIAGSLASLAWLTARMADRWQFLLVGALALLGWNPYTIFDAGFQLSFVAVTAIFVLVPRFQRALDGYPMPRWTRDAVGVSAACGLATAPIMWLQFHAVSLVAIPANALAAPAMVPLLALAFASAATAPVVPAAASVLAWLNGWLAAYIAGCARVVGSLPGAQIQSTRALLLVIACAFLAAAYAWPRWRPSSSPST
jgi:competence protein ComEC